MKAHVQVQARVDTGIVDKLAYRVRCPFIIIKDLGNNSFEVQRYGNADSAVRKYKNIELYLIPPALFPSEVLDTIDQQYLDCNNSTVVSPLLKPMKIDSYNDKWLQPHSNDLNTKSRHVDFHSNEVNTLEFLLHASMSLSTIAELHHNDNKPVDSPHYVETRTVTYDTDKLYASISASIDKLFLLTTLLQVLCGVAGI